MLCKTCGVKPNLYMRIIFCNGIDSWLNSLSNQGAYYVAIYRYICPNCDFGGNTGKTVSDAKRKFTNCQKHKFELYQKDIWKQIDENNKSDVPYKTKVNYYSYNGVSFKYQNSTK